MVTFGWVWRVGVEEQIMKDKRSTRARKYLLQGAAVVAGAAPLLSAAQPVQPIDRLQEIRAALLAAAPALSGSPTVPSVTRWDNWSNWNKV